MFKYRITRTALWSHDLLCQMSTAASEAERRSRCANTRTTDSHSYCNHTRLSVPAAGTTSLNSLGCERTFHLHFNSMLQYYVSLVLCELKHKDSGLEQHTHTEPATNRSGGGPQDAGSLRLYYKRTIVCADLLTDRKQKSTKKLRQKSASGGKAAISLSGYDLREVKIP